MNKHYDTVRWCKSSLRLHASYARFQRTWSIKNKSSKSTVSITTPYYLIKEKDNNLTRVFKHTNPTYSLIVQITPCNSLTHLRKLCNSIIHTPFLTIAYGWLWGSCNYPSHHQPWCFYFSLAFMTWCEIDKHIVRDSYVYYC